MRTYKVVRFFARDGEGPEVIARGLTLAQAMAHCSDPETSSRTAKSERAIERTVRCGAWFDGYEEES